MNITNLLIHLHNNVDAFSLKPRHVEQIRAVLPDVRITVADGNADFMEQLHEADCALVWVFKADWYEKAPIADFARMVELVDTRDLKSLG